MIKDFDFKAAAKWCDEFFNLNPSASGGACMTALKKAGLSAPWHIVSKSHNDHAFRRAKQFVVAPAKDAKRPDEARVSSPPVEPVTVPVPARPTEPALTVVPMSAPRAEPSRKQNRSTHNGKVIRAQKQIFVVGDAVQGDGIRVAVLLECDHVTIRAQSHTDSGGKLTCHLCTRQAAEAEAVRLAEEEKKRHETPADVSAALQLLMEAMAKNGMTMPVLPGFAAQAKQKAGG